MAVRYVSTAAVLSCAVILVAAGREQENLRIDPGQSHVVIHVGKAGAFSFAGHAHEVEAPATGTVTLDTEDIARSAVTVEFETAALRVTGKGEPAEDVPEVQRVMLSDRVLDASRFPKVAFRSRRVTGVTGSAPRLTLVAEGDLTLHGVTKACTVPLRLTLGEGTLSAEGKTTIKQTDFGIQPVAVGGGTVRVKDALEVDFVIRATR